MSTLQSNLLISILIIFMFIIRKLFRNHLTGRELMFYWRGIAVAMLLFSSFSLILTEINLMNLDILNSIYSPIVVSAKKFEVYVQNNFAPYISKDNWITEILNQAQFGYITLVAFLIIIVLLVRYLLNYQAFVKKMGDSIPANTASINKWKKAHPLTRNYQIAFSTSEQSPLTYGFFKPVILLPKRMSNYPVSELSLILEHEFQHIRHFDSIQSLTFLIFCCFNWFNPFFWLMFKAVKQDLELLCDENVLKQHATDIRKKYASLLLREMEGNQQTIATGLNFAKQAAKERLTNIMLSRQKCKRNILSLRVSVSVLLLTISGGYILVDSHYMIIQNAVASSINGQFTTTVKADLVSTNEFLSDVEPSETFWTYQEYQKFVKEETKQLIQLAEQGVNGFSELEVQQTISLYEKNLNDIQNGAKFSKSSETSETVVTYK